MVVGLKKSGRTTDGQWSQKVARDWGPAATPSIKTCGKNVGSNVEQQRQRQQQTADRVGHVGSWERGGAQPCRATAAAGKSFTEIGATHAPGTAEEMVRIWKLGSPDR